MKPVRLVCAMSIVAGIAILVLATHYEAGISQALSPEQIVQQSWERARQSGAYRFAADMLQTETPLALAQNVGQTSRQQTARLEGQTDLQAQRMAFTLWTQGGSVLDQASGAEVKIENGRGYARQGDQPWREIDDLSSAIAPQSDFMSFLSAARNIRQVAEGVYQFELDGPAFARFVRDQTEQQLVASGKLPDGMVIQVSSQYAGMTGTGELRLNAQGLPAYQHIRLVYPADQNGYQTQADITTTFSDYGAIANLPAAAAALDPRTAQAAIVLAFLGITGLALIGGRRSRRVYAGLVIAVMTSMTIGTPLQQAQAQSRTATFLSEQAARADVSRQTQADSNQARQAQARLSTPRIAPNTSPLETAQQKQSALSTLPAQTGALPLPDVQTPQAPAAQPPIDPALDTDKDGLPDVHEIILGTSRLNPDSDSDGITDTLEVDRFDYGGKRWYLDPLKADTNDDGLADSAECSVVSGRLACPDTDGDGTPDVWSRDNDGDGVPDSLDLSPYQKPATTFSADNPLTVMLDGLTPNKPTYVEFQIRPTNPDHLRYAFNVYKWPKGDVSGQIMDADGKTFKDVNPNSTNPQDANGDVKLVPMLEIVIAAEGGQPANMPDASELKPYGIAVRRLTEDGNQWAAYVPLRLVTDNGDNRVAFQAKMLYRPGLKWGSAHQVRLVWVVDALVDICTDDGIKDGRCANFKTYNQEQAVQTYFDTFTLTGLSVREDHGVDMAIVSKDPAVLTDTVKQINQFGALGDLVFGLDRAFLTGRIGDNGQRDFPLSEIRRRFDHAINAGVPVSPTRFDIAQNIFSVRQLRFEHLDQAVAAAVMTETKSVLAAYTPLWNAVAPLTPTLLFAREERFRSLNLDAYASAQGSQQNITWAGNLLTLRMPMNTPAGGVDPGAKAVPIATHVAMNAAPYAYDGRAWRSQPMDTYLKNLANIYPANTIDADPSAARGALVFLRLYATSLYMGYAGIVELAGTPIMARGAMVDAALASANALFGALGSDPNRLVASYVLATQGKFIKDVIDATRAWRAFDQVTKEISAAEVDVIHYDEITGSEIVENWEPPPQAPAKTGVRAQTLMACIAILLVVMIVANVLFMLVDVPPVFALVFNIVLNTAIFSLSLFVAIRMVRATKFIADVLSTRALTSTARVSSLKVNIIIALIIAVVEIAFFLIDVFKSDLKAGSLEFNQRLGMLIANLIFLVILIALSSTGIGAIIALVLGFIDSILKLIFGFGVAEMLGVLCIYNADVMVELFPVFGGVKTGFGMPGLGFSAGNTLSYATVITTTAKQTGSTRWTTNASLVQKFYLSLYTIDSLKRTAVNYSLGTERQSVPATYGSMMGEWQGIQYDHGYWGKDMMRAHVVQPVEQRSIPLAQAGINQKLSLWLNMGYEIPVIECVTLVCYRRSKTGNTNTEISLILDVFPRTLDEFAAWNWSNDGSLPFPAPKDRDNDGLISQAYGGNDPDDTKWDTDGDTLSDGYEIGQAQQPYSQGGGAFDPRRADTDGDGVRDDEEDRRRTNPALPDTDSDGLSDRFEIDGYAFSYTAGKSTLARPNPLKADSDRDGLSDAFEFGHANQFYHPLVANSSPLVAQAQTNLADRYVSPGQRFLITRTLSTPLDQIAPVKGTVATALPAWASIYQAPDSNSFYLFRGRTATQTLGIQVSASATSQTGTIASQACGQQTLPLSAIPFNEPAGATAFANAISNGARYNAIRKDGVTPIAGVPGPIGAATAIELRGGRLQLTDSARDLNFIDGQPFSLAVWAKWTPNTRPGISDFGVLISKMAGEWDSVRGAYELYLYRGPGGDQAITLITSDFNATWWLPATGTLIGRWNHIVIGTQPYAYLNGTRLWNGQVNRRYGNTGDSAQLAALIGGSGHEQNRRSYLGGLADLYVYDRLLDDAEIQALAHPALRAPAVAACDVSGEALTSLVVDADTPTSTLTAPLNGAYVNVTGTLVIGGQAHDPTSYVRQVDTAIDGRPWQAADGADAWAYAWNTAGLAEGAHTLRTMATDAVGNVETPSAGTTIIIDRQPPQLSSQVPAMLRAQQNATSQWQVRLTGTVIDPPAGAGPGSGVKAAQVLLQGGPGVAGAGWQAATVSGTTWSAVYALPGYNNDKVTTLYPTGVYTVLARTQDQVNNETEAQLGSFEIDNTPPVANLMYSGLSSTTITATAVVTGLVTDVGALGGAAAGSSVADASANAGAIGSGVKRLEAAFVPLDQVDLSGRAALLQRLDAAGGSLAYPDSSGNGIDGACVVHSPSGACPEKGVPGKVDEAVAFTRDSGHVDLGNPETLRITGTLSVAAWFNTSQSAENLADIPLVSRWTAHANPLGQPGTFWLGWDHGGRLSFRVQNKLNRSVATAASNQAHNDGQWHLAIGVWNGYWVTLYVDGVLNTLTAAPGFGALNTPDLNVHLTLDTLQAGRTMNYAGMLDEVSIFGFALTDTQARALYNYANTAWLPTALAQAGALTTTWSLTVPAGLEGLYQIDLRAVDTLDNRNDNRAQWRAWVGLIDNQPPRVSIRQVPGDLIMELECSATDFNLVETGFACPCLVTPQGKTYYGKVSEWYNQTISDTRRLYALSTSCMRRPNPGAFVHACDSFGQCATATFAPTEATATASAAAQALPSSAVLTPSDQTALTSLAPISVTVAAQGAGDPPATFLQAVTLTVNGAPAGAFAYPDGAVTSTESALTWAPAADGRYVFQTAALDWAGQQQTETYTSTVVVDTQPPAIDIHPLVYTTAHQLLFPGVRLTGPVSDTAGVQAVDVGIDGGDPFSATLDGGGWVADWDMIEMAALDEMPDGQTFTITARAVDLGGHSVQANRVVTVDIVPPAEVTVTLSYSTALRAPATVSPGDTVRDISPSLTIAWTPSHDGSGIQSVYAGWVPAQADVELEELAAYPPGALHSDPESLDEAGAYDAVVVVIDNLGNQTWHFAGPVFVDAPRTPDYAILLPSPYAAEGDRVYHGWLDSGCAQLGVDRGVSETSGEGAALADPQTFNATWDDDGLRLAWRGADWDGDGDLFIYLSVPGGPSTIDAYNPFTGVSSDTVELPAPASYLVWVKDAQQAELHRWDGSQWALVEALPADGYAFSDEAADDGDAQHYTDLYLPFDLLGITDPPNTPVDLVAFASESDALRVWAAMPADNPHNSGLLGDIANWSADPQAPETLALDSAYHWNGFKSDICPSRVANAYDLDLRSTVAVSPTGTITKSRFGALYLATQLPVDTTHPPLGDGQPITYTFVYTNAGSEAGPNALVVITSDGSIRLLDSFLISPPGEPEQYLRVITLGHILPGAVVTVQAAGVVKTLYTRENVEDCRKQHPADPQACDAAVALMRRAAVSARLVAEAPDGGAMDAEEYAVQHAVDAEGPEQVAVIGAASRPGDETVAARSAARADANTASRPALTPEAALALPPLYVRSGSVELLGTAADAVGVATVTVELLDSEGDTHTTACPQSDAQSVQWMCDIAVPASPTGQRFFVRASAVDPFGNDSVWSGWRALVIDNQPPTIALDPVLDGWITQTILGGLESQYVYGLALDNFRVQRVIACYSEEETDTACQAVDVETSQVVTGVWTARLPLRSGVDGGWLETSLVAVDEAGNESEPLELSLHYDTQPPQVDVQTRVLMVALPGYLRQPYPILAGAAQDGGGLSEIVIRMETPVSGTQRLPADLACGSQPGAACRWVFTPTLEGLGTYLLALEARDLAGNLTELGPFDLSVLTALRYWMPIIAKRP